MLAVAFVAAWSVLQPVRSVRAGDVAIERLERGELDAAVSVAQIAHQRNPLSPEPLWELAYIEEQRGRLANAQRAYEQAVQIQPAAAETWRRLGRFQLSSSTSRPRRSSRSGRRTSSTRATRRRSRTSSRRHARPGAGRQPLSARALSAPGANRAAWMRSKPVASSAVASERRV